MARNIETLRLRAIQLRAQVVQLTINKQGHLAAQWWKEIHRLERRAKVMEARNG